MRVMNVKISGDTMNRMHSKNTRHNPIYLVKAMLTWIILYLKRYNYGAIIVDKNSHIPVTVLERRDRSVLKAWLKQVKQVNIVET